jgi:drug/metabolite transporter (DMT)-like permease
MGRESIWITEIMLLLLLATLWGSSYTLIKIALNDFPPLTLIAIRCVIAALFLCVVMIWRDQRLPSDLQTWRMLGNQSILSSVGAWTILAWGQQYIDSSLASVLNSMSPVFVIFFTLLITRHEQVGVHKWIGGLLGISGVILIVGIDSLNGLGKQVLGQLAVLAGAGLYAGAAIYGKRFSQFSAIVTAAGTMIFASFVLIPASLIVDQPWLLEPSARSVIAALTLGILCTGAALMVYFRLIKTLGSVGVASQSYLRAGIGVALGVIFLEEEISFLVGLGIFIAIIGVVIINYPVKAHE